jgi:hypothetical protein
MHPERVRVSSKICIFYKQNRKPKRMQPTDFGFLGVGAGGYSNMIMAQPTQPAMMQAEPMYVNAKQYHRILKRRAARQKMEAELKSVRARKPYMHESRHRHAVKRPRGADGRFLTAQEIAELRKAEQATAAATPADQRGKSSNATDQPAASGVTSNRDQIASPSRLAENEKDLALEFLK